MLAEVTSDSYCFYHSDQLIISEKNDEIGKVTTEFPLILVNHQQGFTHILLKFIKQQIDEFTHCKQKLFMVKYFHHLKIQHKALLCLLSWNIFRKILQDVLKRKSDFYWIELYLLVVEYLADAFLHQLQSDGLRLRGLFLAHC